MPNYKYVGSDAKDIPIFGIHVTEGVTVEIPEEFADQFDADPEFESSRRKTADVSPDPATVTGLTGPVPVQAPAAPDQVPA